MEKGTIEGTERKYQQLILASNKIEENHSEEKYIIPPDNKNINKRKTMFVELRILNFSISSLYLK